MDDGDLEDDGLTGQGMVQVHRHRGVVDGVNAVGDDAAVRPRKFALEAEVPGRGGELFLRQFLKGRRVDAAERLGGRQLEPHGVADAETFHALVQAGRHAGVAVHVGPGAAVLRRVNQGAVGQIQRVVEAHRFAGLHPLVAAHGVSGMPASRQPLKPPTR